MNYIRKICPICGDEFFILDTVKENATYCNLKCLIEFTNRMNEVDLMLF